MKQVFLTVFLEIQRMRLSQEQRRFAPDLPNLSTSSAPAIPNSKKMPKIRHGTENT
jgi:hypothetical protein